MQKLRHVVNRCTQMRLSLQGPSLVKSPDCDSAPERLSWVLHDFADLLNNTAHTLSDRRRHGVSVE